MHDLRFAIRQLCKNRGFTLVAVLTLGLGIGANTAMFSLLNALLFQPLAYPNSERLVRVYRTSPQSRHWPHSPANFLDHREQNKVFAYLTAFTSWSFNSAEAGQPAERLQGVLATGDFFLTLGLPPVLGRVFTAEDDQPGRNHVAVISHRFWQRRFGADTNVIGRMLRLDGQNVAIIGVMPLGFGPQLLSSTEVWKPFGWTSEERASRGNNWLNEMARLKPGITIRQAQAGMATLATRLAKEHPGENTGNGLRVISLLESTVDESARRTLWFAFGLTLFVLLIACANIANLQLARIVARSRELAVRAALGAARSRLVRQLLTESLLLSALGGGLGVLLALWGNQFLSRHLSLINNDASLRIPLNLAVLAFAVLCVVVTTIIFGSAPAWFASRADVNTALKQGTRGSTVGRSHHRLRHALIVGEVALALILLTGAGLFIRGLERFTRLDPGWRVDGLVTAQLALSSAKYEQELARQNFATQLEQRLSAMPGVRGVGLSSMLPLWGFGSRNFGVEGQPTPPRGQEPLTYYETVSPGFFRTMGIGLREGRGFNSDDTTNRPAVVVINESMARHFWPRQSAIGKRLGTGDLGNPDWKEIVGVVNDISFPANLNRADTPFQAYRPIGQMSYRWLTVELRIEGPVEPVAAALRRETAEIDPELPVSNIELARKTLNRTFGSASLVGRLLGAFAILGLLLAGIGIYGVISYSVAQRTNEFGIRMALGAQRGNVLWLILKQGLRLSLFGALLGFLGTLAVTRLLAVAVPEIPSRDPATVVVLTCVLVSIAAFACWLPARRATQVDPMEALRHE